MDSFPDLTLEDSPQDNALKEHLKWRYRAIFEHQKNQLRSRIKNKKR